jgi:hypothetical protein
MRLLHENPQKEGRIYELHNMTIFAKHIPAMIVVGERLYNGNSKLSTGSAGVCCSFPGSRLSPSLVFSAACSPASFSMLVTF